MANKSRRNSRNKTRSTGSNTSLPENFSVQPGVELGMGSVLPVRSWNNEFYAMKKEFVTLDEIIHMRRHDGQAQALMRLVTLPIRFALQSGKWVEPEEGGGEEETEFANTMWTLPPNAGGMTTTNSKLIRQILLSVSDGFAPFEIVREVAQEGPLKGKVYLRKLAYRDPRTVTIRVDEKGGYKGFKQVFISPNGEMKEINLDPIKTVLFTQQDELNPFYGVSFFESCYPHYDAKRKLYYISHLAAQFAAVPGRMGTVPNSARHRRAEVEQFMASLRDFSFNTSMAMFEGYTVEPFNSNSGYDFLKYIDHHNNQMSKAVLANFFDQESRTVLIENATEDASSDVFLLAMETIADDIAAALTQHLMPQFIDLNFGTRKYPVFQPGPLSQANREAIRSMFDKLAVSGILNTTPELVRELEKQVAEDMGLDIDYTEIEKREKEAAEAQQQAATLQEQLQAQAQPDPTGVVPSEQGDNGPTQEEVDQLTAASEALILAAEKSGFLFDPIPVDEGA